MDHQVQNLVLVNGEWVSRPIDVYQALAYARESDSEISESIDKPTMRVPELGLLTKTVLASPHFKFICSANIRHQDLNDVVLIGEHEVHLKEIHDYGHLSHVASKLDFSGRVLTARVLGEPRVVASSLSSPPPKRPSQHRARSSMTGDEEDTLPAEVIVLTLTSRTLMFLWARQARPGTIGFVQKTVKLPHGASHLDRFGTFLAVDPRNRAMAVAAREGAFILYKLKSMKQWRQESRSGENTTPIEDERILPIEGRIQHMEFLSSGTSRDDYHVVLLFVIVHQGKTKLTCFDWDCREDLSRVTARTERVLVDIDDYNPSLLVPLSRSPDFLLVYNAHISVYKDVLSGAPRRIPVDIPPPILSSLLPGDGRFAPSWVAWDKTVRNPEFSKEVFYIAREDGRIMYVERDSAGELELEVAGEWPYRIDSAFACLSVDNSRSSPDLLISAGIGNDGLVCRLGAWAAEYSYDASYPQANQLTYVESVPNWTPTSDMSLIHMSGPKTSHGRDRPSIFVANGASPHGRLSELRYGIQASVDDSFGGMIGCTGLWVIDHGTHTVELDGKLARQHWATFAITLSPETLVIRVLRTQRESRGEFSGAWEDGTWDKTQLPSDDEPIEDGVMRDLETITACPWSDQCALQVTRAEARLLRRPSLQQIDAVTYNNPLLLAASRPGFPIVAVSYRENGIAYLEALCISNEGTFVKHEARQQQRHVLDHDPTCVELFEVDGIKFVFTSTFGSKMFLYRIEGKDRLIIVWEVKLPKSASDGHRILLENAAVLSINKHNRLVCATRSGYILNLAFSPDASNFTSDCGWTVIGATSARITASATDSSAAFVSCSGDFCRVRISLDDPSNIKVASIWFTNRNHPTFLQSQVTAMYQLPIMQDSSVAGRNLGGFLFAVSGDQLLSSQLDSDIRWANKCAPPPTSDECRSIPREISLGTKPTNMLYLKAFRKMVVSTIEAKEEQSTAAGLRSLRSTIQLVHVHDDIASNEQEIKVEDGEDDVNHSISATFTLRRGERVYSMIEWPFEDHRRKRYTLIIVGTGIPNKGGKESGRKLIFSSGKNGTSLKLQKEFHYDDPVYCVAVYDNAFTMTAVGKKLSLDEYDSEAGKMSTKATTMLPSVATHVTVRDCFVSVSTLRHSHIFFRVITEPRRGYEFIRTLTDSHERSCAHHLELKMSSGHGSNEMTDNIILITDKSAASVSGLFRADERTYKNSAKTLFEACLPRTIVRLSKGDIRPSWRRLTDTSSLRPQGILIDDVLGACTDGTIYSLSILSQSARRLLRYLQNIIEEKARRNPANHPTPINPRSGAIHDILMNGADGAQDDVIHAHPLNPAVSEKSNAGPRWNHVDGDLLKRWLEEDGDLEKLVSVGTDSDVVRLLGEFVREVWSTESAEWGWEEVLRRLKEWLGEVVMPLL